MWTRCFRRSPSILLLTFGVLFSPTRVAADPISVANAAIDMATGYDPARMGVEGRFIFAISPVIHRQLFNEIVLTPADAGRTFFVDATTDADVPYFIQLLTNGVGNYNEVLFATAMGMGGIGRAAEGPLFGLTRPDLKGLSIGSFSFTVHSFGIDDRLPGENFLRVRGTLSALAEGDPGIPSPTPEPASLLLVGSGIAGLIGRARWKRAR